MKPLINISTLRIYILFMIPLLYSCSKDKEEPLPPLVLTVSTSDFSATMDEKPMAGQVIGFVEGSTNMGSVTFSITEQTPNGAFSIDPASGELKVADESLFDFETNTTITGTVKVANGAVSENASVSITLREIFEDKIFEGAINLKTQAEVDAFGQELYTRITGTLNIGMINHAELSDIDDISSLSSLVYVGNQLIVAANPNLLNLKGLDNIKFVKGQILIAKNASLTTIESLGSIEDFYQNITVAENDNLKNLDGLNFLERMGYLQIVDNKSLQNIDSLSQLKEAYKVSILDNKELISVRGLQNLKSLEGGLLINRNSSLQDLVGLEGLTSLGKELNLINNDLLLNIDPLRNLTTFPESILISDNSSLQSISGLRGLKFARNLDIVNNPSLKNLNGLNDLAVVSYYFQLRNSNIQNLDELNNLQYVQSIGIHHNKALENVDGLINLGIVTRHLKISNNNLLKNLDGFANLNFIERDLNIEENSSLIDFCGLQNVLTNNGLKGSYSVKNNAFNPTKQDIIDGNCRL